MPAPIVPLSISALRARAAAAINAATDEIDPLTAATLADILDAVSASVLRAAGLEDGWCSASCGPHTDLSPECGSDWLRIPVRSRSVVRPLPCNVPQDQVVHVVSLVLSPELHLMQSVT